MPDGVDPMMESMKSSHRYRLANGLVGITEPPQLPDRDHSMLPAGQSRQFLPRGRGFVPHRGHKLCRG